MEDRIDSIEKRLGSISKTLKDIEGINETFQRLDERIRKNEMGHVEVRWMIRCAVIFLTLAFIQDHGLLTKILLILK